MFWLPTYLQATHPFQNHSLNKVTHPTKSQLKQSKVWVSSNYSHIQMIKLHRKTSWLAYSTYFYFQMLYSMTRKEICYRKTNVRVFVNVFIFVSVLIWPASTPLSPRRPKAKRRCWRRGRGQDRGARGAHLKIILRMANSGWSMLEQSSQCLRYAIIFRMPKTHVAGLSLPCRSLTLRASV